MIWVWIFSELSQPNSGLLPFLLELVVEVEALEAVEVRLVCGLWDRVNSIWFDWRVREDDREKEESEEVVVGWARSKL
ncbi:hypothetical protein TorRG33x02_288070 [Trema orientale]|uniref:Uncharacterized protein n=1 Tax=Trema orientale TaxID=63057 RepID=A0A2P5CEQ6_TREOI|nr:hypothetical protein TorRG33x02_288070 [Trema orientale]